MSLFFIFGFLKPKSFFHERTNKIAVIASSKKTFKRNIVFHNVKFPINIVGEIDDEKKLLKFVYFLTHYILRHFY